MASKRLVLLNNEAKIVRTFVCESRNVVVGIDKETQRLMVIASKEVNASEELKNKIDVIKRITVNSLECEPLTVGNNKLVLDSGQFGPGSVSYSEKYREEDSETIKLTLKKSAISHGMAVLLIILTAFFYGRFIKDHDKEKVTDVKIINVEKKKIIKTVSVSKDRIKKTKPQKYARKRKIVKKPSRSVRNGRGRGKVGRYKTKSVSHMGVLGALGGVHAGKNIYAKVGSKSGNVKYGRSGNKGGSMRSVVGKGLVASGYGKDEVVGGAGKYQRRGHGGGNNGYGRHVISGSQFGFLQSLPEESHITGGLAQEQIDSVIRRNQGQMIYCYEKGLQQDKKLKGRVSLSFVINGSGRVKVANVKQSNLRSKIVENCVVNKLKKFKFPKPAGKVNVKVTYPFMFQLAGRG